MDDVKQLLKYLLDEISVLAGLNLMEVKIKEWLKDE